MVKTKITNNDMEKENYNFGAADAATYSKYYTESGFWSKVKHLGKKAGSKVAFPALLLYYVLASRDVPVKIKGTILGALGYLILPIDIIPDFIPIAGYDDDLAVLATVVKLVAEYTDEEIERKARAKAAELFGV